MASLRGGGFDVQIFTSTRMSCRSSLAVCGDERGVYLQNEAVCDEAFRISCPHVMGIGAFVKTLGCLFLSF